MATTAYDLHDVKVGGSIKEDVLDKIFAIDPVDLEFTTRAGSDSVVNDRYSWLEDELNPIDTSITREDASESTGNDHVTPDRVWNQSEMRTKIVAIGDRAQAVDSIGVASLMSDSVMKRNKELRKEFEASFLGNSASVAADNSGSPHIPARTAGVQSFIVDQYYAGSGGSAGGWNSATATVDAPTAGTERAMSEAFLIEAEEATYTEGGEPDVIISTPAIIGKMAKYFASNSGAAATLYSDVGTKDGGMRIKSAVKVYEGQYLTFELVASRELQATSADGAPVLGMDFDFWQVATLTGIHGYDLAKTGLYERKELMGDKGVKALNQKSSFCIADIDGSLDMVA